MSSTNHIVCPQCATTNAVPGERLAQGPKCGKCSQALFEAKPLELDAQNFSRHLNRNDIPMLVDFWAPWCQPCLMMAPQYEAAAAELEPAIRVAKLDTEAVQIIAGQFQIRSIPTMILFRNGGEVARHSGAMMANDIVAWARQHA